jgi:putative transposase
MAAPHELLCAAAVAKAVSRLRVVEFVRFFGLLCRKLCYAYCSLKQRRPVQQVLPFGPRRRPKHWKKPGPKPREELAGLLRHLPRPHHDKRHPALVTMRCVAAAPSLRSELVAKTIAAQIRHALGRRIGVVHYSIQDNHLHLMVEAEDKTALARGMQLLFSRIAFEVNRVAKRHGRLFRDRHHREALTSPTQTRRALVYVLFNGRKHRVQKGHPMADVLRWLDPCSTAAWFDGWSRDYAPTRELLQRTRAGPCASGAKPQTWLARIGWVRGGGYVRYDEIPSSA